MEYTCRGYRGQDINNSAHFDNIVNLAYLCLPQIFFYGVNVLLGQVLNARGRFAPMAWSPLANNVVAVLVLVVYLGVWGHAGESSVHASR